MNLKPVSRIIFATQALLFLGLLIQVRDAKAQESLMARPEVSITPPAVQQYQTDNQMEVFAPPDTVTHPDDPPIQLGPVGLRPNVFYRFLYGSGVPTSGTNHVTTTIQDVSPGFLFEVGSHWRLDYTPTWRFYSNRQFQDTLDHNVRLLGGTTYEDWFFGLSQTYASSSATLVETGTQTEQQIYSTTLKASYHFNSEMSVDLAINQNLVFAAQFSSSREWSTLEWLNYRFWPRLDAAIGAGFGYVDMDTGSDMTYEQLQGRINWRATDKLSFQVRGGLENRQTLVSGASDVLNPIAAAVIHYQPFEVTRLSLSADRVVSTSLLTASSGNQVTETTAISGKLSQRLFKKLYLDLEGSYHLSTYVAASTAATSREDDYSTFNARLSCPFLKRGTAAVFYQYSDYSSTTPGYTYDSSQVGFELGYRF